MVFKDVAEDQDLGPAVGGGADLRAAGRGEGDVQILQIQSGVRGHGIGLGERVGVVGVLPGVIREVPHALEKPVVDGLVVAAVPGGVHVIVETADADDVPGVVHAGDHTDVQPRLLAHAVEQDGIALAHGGAVVHGGVGGVLQLIAGVAHVLVVVVDPVADEVVDGQDLLSLRLAGESQGGHGAVDLAGEGLLLGGGGVVVRRVGVHRAAAGIAAAAVPVADAPQQGVALLAGAALAVGHGGVVELVERVAHLVIKGRGDGEGDGLRPLRQLLAEIGYSAVDGAIRGRGGLDGAGLCRADRLRAHLLGGVEVFVEGVDVVGRAGRCGRLRCLGRAGRHQRRQHHQTQQQRQRVLEPILHGMLLSGPAGGTGKSESLFDDSIPCFPPRRKGIPANGKKRRKSEKKWRRKKEIRKFFRIYL